MTFANLVQSCMLETDVMIWESWYTLVMLTTHHHIMSWHVRDMAGLYSISPKFGAVDITGHKHLQQRKCIVADCELLAASCKIEL